MFLFHLAPERLAGGFVGVDLFFVISGYLITGQIRRAEEAGGFSLVTFYERRIARIAPAGLFVITCVLAAASMLFLAPDLVA